MASCIGHCERSLSPRVVYERADLIASERACSLEQACGSAVDRAISSCQSDVLRRLEPSATDRAYCHAWVEKSIKCGDYRWDEEHCIWATKTYSDAIVHQLADCIGHPCRGLSNYGRCGVAVVGIDPVWADQDRIAEFASTPVPDAGAATVRIAGKVTTESDEPIPGALVCVRDLRDGPCVRSSESGAFALDVPAHADIAISARATGYGNALAALTTRGANLSRWNLTLTGDTAMLRRYAAVDAPYPDDASAHVLAMVRAPEGSASGLEGVTIGVIPKPGLGPLYFGPDSQPDRSRSKTSTWSEALFAGVPPGEVTVTFGPQSLACVPLDRGWPSPIPNSIRIPVAAGFETRIAMRCHW
jgi:hypothetical protein